MKSYILPVIVVVTLFAAVCGAAEPPVLTPEPARITDSAISADIETINALQTRLADINRQGMPVDSYQFAKAQAWLDMAMDQYVMNDRSLVVEDALGQASRLIEQLEAKKADMDRDTEILPTSRMIRPDLWYQAAELKKHPGFVCGEGLVAQMEVQLVWAGHEENQLGWRHAKPYLQAAERLAGEARRKIEACPAAQAAAVERPQQPVEPAQSQAKEETAVPFFAGVVIPDRVHFALNSDAIGSQSAAVLERLALVMRADQELKVELQGHADERGSEAFNLVLSKRRAEVVRTYLVAAGGDPGRITLKAFGGSQPFARGNDLGSYARNRRVAFEFSAGNDQLRPFAQFEDLRIEEKRAHDR